jgi:hypothetical protein
MKKFLLALIAVAALFFVYSCENDGNAGEKDGNAGGKDSIVGTWEYYDNSYSDEEYSVTITFKSNGRGVWEEYYYDGYEEYIDRYAFDYEYSDEYLELDFDEGFTEAYDCVIKGNKMILDGEVVFRRR